MDRFVYIAGSGAKQMLEKQASISNNLANASTAGFRAQIDAFRSVPVQGGELPTRAFVVDATVGANFAPGPVMQTGRELDVAIQGTGWIAVTSSDGSEAYTRHGALQVSANGLLQSASGNDVLGDSGPISIPPGARVSIAKDGTVSGVAGGVGPASVFGRIKLVNPPEAGLERRPDGLFALKGGASAEAYAGVTLIDGALEGSNVNVVETMVEMINAARQFDMQMKMIQTAETDEAKAAQLLSLA